MVSDDPGEGPIGDHSINGRGGDPDRAGFHHRPCQADDTAVVQRRNEFAAGLSVVAGQGTALRVGEIGRGDLDDKLKMVEGDRHADGLELPDRKLLVSILSDIHVDVDSEQGLGGEAHRGEYGVVRQGHHFTVCSLGGGGRLLEPLPEASVSRDSFGVLPPSFPVASFATAMTRSLNFFRSLLIDLIILTSASSWLLADEGTPLCLHRELRR